MCGYQLGAARQEATQCGTDRILPGLRQRREIVRA